EGRHRVGRLRADSRLQRQRRGRHGRRAGRLAADDGGEADVGCRLAGDGGLAAGVLGGAVAYPLLDDRQRGVGQARRLGRHVRWLLVRPGAEQQAALGVARLDAHAGGAALHGGGVVGQAQPAALLVLVVAADALVAQDRQDVLVVSRLRLLRLRGGTAAG